MKEEDLVQKCRKDISCASFVFLYALVLHFGFSAMRSIHRSKVVFLPMPFKIINICLPIGG